ncbi:hypothetical protein [Bartonella grahamii]|uniref:hypothetical protein n=1 Tax=Bartonella grahamii TaxID=33045 RepID=UPI001FEF0802|nr:hypothetical protein [Bartonella grahamii]
MRIKASLRLVDLYKRRIIIYSLLLLIALFHYADSPFGFIAVSISIGYLSLITLSTLETYNTKLALGGYISAQKASRIMQTVVQIGAFLGAALSGYLLEATSPQGAAAEIGYNGLIVALCVFDIIISLIAGYIIFCDEYNATDTTALATDKKPVPTPQANGLSRELKLLCVCIVLIGFHICAYNTLATILFQSVKNFGSEYYGLCSAVAGMGAFLAAFIKIPRFEFILPALMLSVADLIFSTTQSPYLAVVFCFFIGFSMNTMRINARKHTIEATKTEAQAELVGSYSGMLYTLSQSAGLCYPWSSYKLCPYGSSSSCLSSPPYRLNNLYLCSFPFIAAEQSMRKTILIVDPFSTGALYGPALQKLGYACYGVVSQPDLFSRYMLSYQGKGMAEAKLHNVDEIKTRFPIGAIESVVAGAEGGIYCADQLAAYYNCPGNNPSTTDWRRKKAAMQKRLCENGLSYIRSKILTKDNCAIDDFESHSGYVVKPNDSAGS